MKKIIFFYLLSYFLCFIVSCTKEGTGGKATIKGSVKHHDMPIPGAAVYIKYNATELPGTNVTYYDDHVICDASANFQIVDLKKGDYYLFAVGFDSTWAGNGATVSGGVGVKIKKKTETVETLVAVNEQ